MADLASNCRNVYNLVALTPGVVPKGGTTSVGNAATGNVNGWGNYQIGGGAGNQSASYLDGAPVNISYVNSTILVPTQDFARNSGLSRTTSAPSLDALPAASLT